MFWKCSLTKMVHRQCFSRDFLRMSSSETISVPPVPRPRTERQAQLRAEFLSREAEWERGVNQSNLSAREKLIHSTHNQAVQNLHFTYDDPETGLKVLTRLRHFLKGTCCGNACRHCIYSHQNVDPKLAKRKMFNTSFWIDNPDYDDDGDDDEDQFS